MTTKTKFKTININAVIEKSDPKQRLKKTVSYEFSNGRKFHDKKAK